MLVAFEIKSTGSAPTKTHPRAHPEPQAEGLETKVLRRLGSRAPLADLDLTDQLATGLIVFGQGVWGRPTRFITFPGSTATTTRVVNQDQQTRHKINKNTGSGGEAGAVLCGACPTSGDSSMARTIMGRSDERRPDRASRVRAGRPRVWAEPRQRRSPRPELDQDQT